MRAFSVTRHAENGFKVEGVVPRSTVQDNFWRPDSDRDRQFETEKDLPPPRPANFIPDPVSYKFPPRANEGTVAGVQHWRALSIRCRFWFRQKPDAWQATRPSDWLLGDVRRASRPAFRHCRSRPDFVFGHCRCRAGARRVAEASAD